MMESLNRLARRVLQMVGRGRIRFVDDSGAVQRVQVQFNDLETIDEMLRVSEFGFASNPPPGTDAVALFIAGDRSGGLIIGTNNQQYRMVALGSGDAAIYDSRGQSVWLTDAGIVVNGAGLPLAINNTPTVTVNASIEVELNTPLLNVTGNIKSGGSIAAAGDITDNTASGNAESMASGRRIYDGHGHPVSGIQTGSSSVVSGVPNQQE